jgi:hypothetical protein
MSPMHRRKGAAGKADRLCKEIVHARKWCQLCGKQGHEWAHIVGRGNNGDPDGIALRTNPDNAWFLCSYCHWLTGDEQLQFLALVEKTIGLDAYKELIRVKHSAHRGWRTADWEAECVRLQALLEAVDV